MTTTIKTDFPPFRMEIIGGRLSPKTQFDAERLDSFSARRELQVYITQEPNRALQRKFFAVLNKVVKECRTPWRNATQASDALKIAWGHLNRFRKVDGTWGYSPKSLNDFDDDDFQQFFDDSMATLEAMTGVDPLTLKAESASTDAPDDIQSDAEQPRPAEEASPESPPADVEAGSPNPSSEPASEIQESEGLSSSQADGSGDAPDGGGATPPAPPPANQESAEPPSTSEVADKGDDESPKEAGSPHVPASEYTIVDYARQLLHTASTIMGEERFKPLNVEEAKDAMRPTVAEEKKKLGKDLSKTTKELMQFTHGIVEAILRGDRRPGAARSAIAGQFQTIGGIEVQPADLVMEEV